MPRLIQNTLKPLWELKKVMGIDNVTTDDLRLRPGFVRVCENVNIDDEFMIERRDGVLQKILTGVAHSGWSDGTDCFLVLDDDLVQLNTDWTLNTLVSAVGPSRMNFTKHGTMIFFSNLKYAGFIEAGVAYPFADNFRINRAKMAGGGLIEFLNGRLYSTQDEFIYRSIVGNAYEIDLEKDFIYMGGEISMMIGVNGIGVEPGLFTSSAGKCNYLSNLEPNLENVSWRTVVDVPALPGSAVAIEEIDLGKGGGLLGRGCIWSTSKGIYLGMPGGKVKDLTSEHYKVEGIVNGFATIRDYKGYRQYIYSGFPEAGIGQAGFEIEEFTPLISMTGG